MVGTCLDPPLWSDLRKNEKRTGWCERGDEEKLTACAIPPTPKDTVFTQVFVRRKSNTMDSFSLRLPESRLKFTYPQQLHWSHLLLKDWLLPSWVAPILYILSDIVFSLFILWNFMFLKKTSRSIWSFKIQWSKVINTTVELPLLPLEGALGIRVPLVDSPSGGLIPSGCIRS